MNTTTQPAFASTARKLALGVALVYGTAGMAGCKKETAPSINVVSIDTYDLGGKKFLATTHVFHGGGERKLTWFLLNNGTETLITECTFTPDISGKGTTVKTILLNDGQSFYGDCKLTNFQGSSMTQRSTCPSPKDFAVTTSSHYTATIFPTSDETLYCGVHAGPNAASVRGDYQAQLEDSKKVPDHYFLILRMVSPAPKTK